MTILRIRLKDKSLRMDCKTKWPPMENVFSKSDVSVTIGCRCIIGTNGLNRIPHLDGLR